MCDRNKTNKFRRIYQTRVDTAFCQSLINKVCALQFWLAEIDATKISYKDHGN